MDITEKFNNDGIIVIPAVLSNELTENLKSELSSATKFDLEKNGDRFDRGMIHNCMLHGESLLTLLDHPSLYKYVSILLDKTSIVYAYQSSTLPPKSKNYGSRVHVDCPRFIKNHISNLGVIFPLDDFTIENGGTFYLPGSHLIESLPDDDYFYRHAKQVTCKKGDMIIFNARLAHAAGENNTAQGRYALTINFCRSYMRQRFDYPRLVPEELIGQLGDIGKQFLGMNVRVPTSLEEFYLPEELRLYKPNQG
ncbi:MULTISPECIES: phytanoyl-CoA dioxygenase family protein [unclassified Agarivorans]|uniref:phytanoyl-CoA dioxygenase family protein n=1 Tax=unclassified Agarivorans TaxID=2636026 RepID=UPI0026E1A393|nr:MULTISPECIES: phytanoyl-CoA dioxygenase family protein [unclassified Agarivorans]MDO6684715.1 phytanoyl-CoA dioxygenase family protein [Agarivorans sp. 3_MG-2023]MDO6715124.1 phytanoyl-CoA dioxygenase family protein [Agarivorans sp. 2_MG-2023]